MVVVMEETYLSQHQSLVLVEAEVPLLWEVQEVSVPAAAEFMVKMFAQLGNPSFLVVTRKDTLRQCATHLGRHSHVLHLLNNIRLCKKYAPMMTRTLVTKQKMST